VTVDGPREPRSKASKYFYRVTVVNDSMFELVAIFDRTHHLNFYTYIKYVEKVKLIKENSGNSAISANILGSSCGLTSPRLYTSRYHSVLYIRGSCIYEGRIDDERMLNIGVAL